MAHVLEVLKQEARSVPNRKIGETPYLRRDDDDLFDKQGSSVLIFKEVAYVVGKIKMFRRVFVKSKSDVAYSRVGWVVDVDMNNCMICGTQFYLFDKHHCRVCGDLVCEGCSEHQVYLVECQAWGAVRACQLCYFGQDKVSLLPPNRPQTMQSRGEQRGSSMLSQNGEDASEGVEVSMT